MHQPSRQPGSDLLSTPLQAAAAPTAGAAPRDQVHFLSQHSSCPGTAACTTANLLLSYCTTLQTKAADRRAYTDFFFFPIFFLSPRPGARGPLMSLRPASLTAAAICVAHMGTPISLTRTQVFQSYYLISKVQRDIRELPVNPNMCGRLNSISC